MVVNFRYYQNLKGLRTKCIDLYLASSACYYDIIAFSETWWLDPAICYSELSCSDFIVYICDRSVMTTLFSRGGGELISVRFIHPSEQISVLGVDSLEIVNFLSSTKRMFVHLLFIYSSW